MPLFNVRYEVRAPGALGVFEWRTFTVRADTADQAREAAFTAAHLQGYETRGGPIINSSEAQQ